MVTWSDGRVPFDRGEWWSSKADWPLWYAALSGWAVEWHAVAIPARSTLFPVVVGTIAVLGFIGALILLADLWLVRDGPGGIDRVALYDAGTNPSAELEQLEAAASTTRDRVIQVLRPAIRRAELLAANPELLEALRSADRKPIEAATNRAIANVTEVDLISLFSRDAQLLGFNSQKSDGDSYPAEGIRRLFELSFANRRSANFCLHQTHPESVIEFQQECDFSRALIGSRGLGVAVSVPARDLATGEVLGVLSIRLWFDRLSSLLPSSRHVWVSLISEDGRSFSESDEQGQGGSSLGTLIVPEDRAEEMAAELTRGGVPSALFTWRNLVVRVQRVVEERTLEGGAAFVIASADRHWILRDPRQERISFAIGLLAFALLLFSAGALSWAISRRAIAVELESLRLDAESALRTKSAFLAHMSHEIRTPITAVLGYLEVLAEPEGAAMNSASKRLEFIETAQRNARHLLSIVNDVLDFSRIEAQETTVRFDMVDPTALARECVVALAPLAQRKGIALRLDDSVVAPAGLGTDATRLWQILMNLIGNAVKFTDHGEVVVTVRALGAAEVELRVRDTGCGIPLQSRDTLFKPFTQVDASMSRKRGGTGLGLTISKHYIELLGGTILVDSLVGRGTTMIVRLPSQALGSRRDRPAPTTSPVSSSERAMPAKVAEKSPSTEPAELRHALLRGLHVLVVEDYEDNQALMRYFLESVGATVSIAADGAEAVALIERDPQRFDVVLMDMQMPVLDGYAATALLRAHGYPGVIIALTAHALSGEREKCIAAGCTDYLSKPVEHRGLVAKILEYGFPLKSTQQ